MSVAGPPGRVESALAQNKLGASTLIFFAVSAAAPLTILVGLVTVAWQVTGVTGLPLAFVILGAILAVFSVGYIAMAKRIRNAGAFYSYIAQGAGKPFGVAAAFVAVPAYGMLAIALFGMIGPTVKALLPASVAGSVPWWVAALVVWAFVAVMGVLRVDVNGKVLAVALLAEVALVVVCDVIDLLHPAGGSVSMETLTPSSLGSAEQLGVAFAIVMAAFVGFEAPPIFSEESKDAGRTVGRAIFRGLAIMTVLYAGSSWALSVAIGPDQLQQAAAEHPGDLPFAVAAGHVGGPVLIALGQLLYLSSLVAAALSYHNNVTRYLFALGREHVVFAFLGRTTPRTFAPRNASLLLSVTGLAVILTYAAAGADPMITLFYWLGTGGGFGVLLLIIATSLSVPGYFWRWRRTFGEPVSVWQGYLAPVLAAALLGWIAWLIVENFAGLLNVGPDSPMRWAFPAGYSLLALLGAGWAWVLFARRPAVYRAIGLGTTPTAVQDGAPPASPAYRPAHSSLPGGAR
ncbi:APC family permease [Dactylosporangium sp. CS-047395]|uniref:APC family permease n=1 Tax=Dactylosporangium sp. CS-047395 TaxID=3239936 RepID=UPI003D91EE3F